jgi:hypothetical protein
MGQQIPIFAVRGNDPPRNSLFRMLRDMWIEQGASEGKRRKSKDLAVLLDVREQAVSQWASGSDRREPPWWAINRLCHECGRYIEMRPDMVKIVEL